MKISRDMVHDLNRELAHAGCIFEYDYDEYGYKGNPQIAIKPLTTNYLQSYTLNISNAGYEFVRKFFEDRGVRITCNNDRSIIWSADGCLHQTLNYNALIWRK